MGDSSFALGEDVRDESRLMQDEIWKGAISDGRAHVSDREYASLHKEEFIEAIKDWEIINLLLDANMSKKFNVLTKLHIESLKHIIDFAFPGQGPLVLAAAATRHVDNLKSMNFKIFGNSVGVLGTVSTTSSPFRVCVRCRPLLNFELNGGAYNCVAINSKKSSIIVHDGRLARNGRRLTMSHRYFEADRVFNVGITNQEVCDQEVCPLINRSKAGYNTTLICFGQTGTGKTFTMISALDYALKELKDFDIEITFFEIHGKKCYDLLSQRKLVHLDENEYVHVRGARTLSSYDGLCLHDAIREAIKLRSSEVTERNPISSRSHAFCTIKLLSQPGKLTLVDLAGSERNYETTKMTATQHRESADINFGLMALKDCFRAYHAQCSGQRMMMRHPELISSVHGTSSSSRCYNHVDDLAPTRAPYRASLLTRVLRECFINCNRAVEAADGGPPLDQSHHTTIITTISPTPTDVQHTINSINHVSLMSPDLREKISVVTVEVPIKGLSLSHLPVETWTPGQVTAWLVTANNGRFAQLSLPPGLDGSGLMKLNAVGLSALCAGTLRAARQDEEGSAWVVEGNISSDSASGESFLGRALWSALRREQKSQRSVLEKEKTVIRDTIVAGVINT